MVGTGAPGLFFVQISRQLIVAAVLLMILVSILCELHEVRDSFHGEGQVKMGQCQWDLHGPSFFLFWKGFDWTIFSFFLHQWFFVCWFCRWFCRGFANNKWEARWNVNTGGYSTLWNMRKNDSEAGDFAVSTIYPFWVQALWCLSCSEKKRAPKVLFHDWSAQIYMYEARPRDHTTRRQCDIWWAVLMRQKAIGPSICRELVWNHCALPQLRFVYRGAGGRCFNGGIADHKWVSKWACRYTRKLAMAILIGSQWLCIYNLYNLFRGYPVFRAKVRPWRDFLQAHLKSPPGRRSYMVDVDQLSTTCCIYINIHTWSYMHIYIHIYI